MNHIKFLLLLKDVCDSSDFYAKEISDVQNKPAIANLYVYKNYFH